MDYQTFFGSELAKVRERLSEKGLELILTDGA